MKGTRYYIIAILLLSKLECISQQTIVIEGTYKGNRKSIPLSYWEDAALAISVRFDLKIDSLSSGFQFQLERRKPVIIQLADNSILVFPGDTINVKIEDTEKNIICRDTKGADHAFIEELQKEVGAFQVSKFSFDQDGAIERYAAEAKRHYQAKLVFYSQYIARKKTTPEFNEIAKKQISVDFYDNLIYPLSTRKISRERVPKDYFKEVDFAIFEDTSLLPFREYILLLANYNRNFFSESPPKGRSYDSVYVERYIRSAFEDFKGEVKDELLLFHFNALINNGDQHNKSQVQLLYDYLTKAFRNNHRIMEIVAEKKTQFDIVDQPFPKHVLAQRMITTEGKAISLAEILPKNKVVFVDFWASWCAPCIEEMTFERQLISELKGKDIAFIFISLDQNEKAWQKARSKINIEGSHFMIPENFKSSLVQYISFESIPRYLIIDKAGKPKSRDAARPRYILSNKSILLSLLN